MVSVPTGVTKRILPYLLSVSEPEGSVLALTKSNVSLTVLHVTPNLNVIFSFLNVSSRQLTSHFSAFKANNSPGLSAIAALCYCIFINMQV